MQSFHGVDRSYEVTGGDSSTERLIMQELEMKNGLETMLADQRLTAEKYKANFSLLEAQHIQLQSETQQLKEDLAQQKVQVENCGKRNENQIMKLQTEKDQLLLDIEGLKCKVMTPAKLENLRQNLLHDVEMIYKQHLAQTEDEVDTYRKELNKLKFDHNFLKTEYENCQNEYAQKLEDVHVKYKLDIDTLQRKNIGLKKSLEQKGMAAEESVSLMKENTKLTAKVKSLTNENESYRKQINEEIKKGDDKASRISLQLSELSVKHEILSTENKNLVSRIEKLQNKLEQANSDLTKQIPHIAKLEDQNLRFSSDVEDLKQRHKMDLSIAENNFKRLVSDTKKESDNISAQLSDASTNIEFLQKSNEQLKSSLRNKEKEYTEKLQEIKDQQWDGVNRANQDKIQIEVKLAACEKLHSEQLHNLNLELEKLKNTNETLTTNIQTTDKEKESLYNQINKLQSTIDSKEKDLNHYQRMESDNQMLHAQLKSSISQHKEEVITNDKLQSQNKLANEEIGTLRSQIRDMQSEFEKVCQTNKDLLEKEKDAISDKYQALKKRFNKGDKRRQTILSLAKKQKNQHQKEVLALKDNIICYQAREKHYEMEKDSIRKAHEMEVNKLRRQIEQFKVKATEFEHLLYNPISGDNSSGNVNASIPMPQVFTSILAGEREQQHELAELQKNMNDFKEKQGEFDKIV